MKDLRAVLETALDAVVVMDADGRVADWNSSAEAMFGWSRAEAVGRTMAELIVPPALRSAHWQGLTLHLETGRAKILDHRIEVSAVRRDGEEFPVELAITRTETEAGPRFLGFLRDITERKQHEARRQLLLDEMNHRVKNTLATVQAIAMQTARGGLSGEAFTAVFSERLAALARAHDLLTTQSWEGADLETLLGETLAPYEMPGRAIRVEGPAVTLNPGAAVSVNLALHELATNAAKYGAFSTQAGRLDVDWRVNAAGDGLELVWREGGLSGVAPPAGQGFGSRLLKSVARELGARVVAEHGPEGFGYRWAIPLSEKVALGRGDQATERPGLA